MPSQQSPTAEFGRAPSFKLYRKQYSHKGFYLLPPSSSFFDFALSSRLQLRQRRAAWGLPYSGTTMRTTHAGWAVQAQSGRCGREKGGCLGEDIHTPSRAYQMVWRYMKSFHVERHSYVYLQLCTPHHSSSSPRALRLLPPSTPT